MIRKVECLLVLALVAGCGGPAGELLDDESPATATSALHAGQTSKGVLLDTGVELRYVEQGKRGGDPVIFLHGYTDSHRSFDRNLPLFPRHFHAFALDQRGQGDSDKPACCYTQNDFAADVVAFMDALGLERASLVGHSMGSFIAQQVALNYPDRVGRLVLIGSAPTVAGNAGAAELEAAVDGLTDPVDEEFVRAFQASTFFRPIPASYLDTAVSESSKVPAAVWQSILHGLLAEDHSARLGEIRAKTLILYGDQDVFFSRAEQATLHASIPHSKLIVYDGVGHGTHAEVPERVVHDITRFLR